MVIIIPPVTVAKLVGLQRKAKEFKSSEWGVAWKGHQVDAELIGDKEIIERLNVQRMRTILKLENYLKSSGTSY